MGVPEPPPPQFYAPATPKRTSPSNGAVTGLAVVVIALLAAGMVTLQSRSLLTAPSSYPNPSQYQAYVQTIHAMTFGGAVLLDVGVAILLLTAVMVALKRDDIAEPVRRGFLILGTVITALWLAVAFLSTGLGYP